MMMRWRYWGLKGVHLLDNLEVDKEKRAGKGVR